MDIITRSGTLNTEELYRTALSNVARVEEATRENPSDSSSYPIGYVIPLGTLGNAPNRETQFKSNFSIVAYTIAEGLLDRAIDFEDFNVVDDVIQQGQIYKLSKKLEDLAIASFGKGWKITIFNVTLTTAVDSMSKGVKDIDIMQKSMDSLYSIIESRIEGLKQTSEKKPLKHEVVELFYTPLRAISVSMTKILEDKSKSPMNPLGACTHITIETLVYDDWANGLRLLTNTESFASSRIRSHQKDNQVYPFVLKARIAGDTSDFRPVRLFDGQSKVSELKLASGCAERIVYNLVNKNYKHWSFISIPSTLDIKLDSYISME